VAGKANREGAIVQFFETAPTETAIAVFNIVRAKIRERTAAVTAPKRVVRKKATRRAKAPASEPAAEQTAE